MPHQAPLAPLVLPCAAGTGLGRNQQGISVPIDPVAVKGGTGLGFDLEKAGEEERAAREARRAEREARDREHDARRRERDRERRRSRSRCGRVCSCCLSSSCSSQCVALTAREPPALQAACGHPQAPLACAPTLCRSPGRLRYSCAPPKWPTYHGDRGVADVSKRYKDLYLPADFVKARGAGLAPKAGHGWARRPSAAAFLLVRRHAHSAPAAEQLAVVSPAATTQVRPTWQQCCPETNPFPIDRPIRWGSLPPICCGLALRLGWEGEHASTLGTAHHCCAVLRSRRESTSTRGRQPRPALVRAPQPQQQRQQAASVKRRWPQAGCGRLRWSWSAASTPPTCRHVAASSAVVVLNAAAGIQRARMEDVLAACLRLPPPKCMVLCPCRLARRTPSCG